MYMTEPVNVVIALDKNYQDMAKVMLKSLCCYQRNLAIFVLSNEDLDETFKGELTYYLKDKIIDIKFFQMTVPNNFKSHDYISPATYLRYAIEDLFAYGYSDYWLYLDCDMLVVRNILEPFTWAEFQDYALAAVPDVYVKQMKHHVQKFGEDDYFNAGVLYINAKNWKNKDYKQRFVNKTLLYVEELKFADQDVFNLAFKQQWLKLPLQYNLQSDAQSGLLNKQAAVLHFTGSKKPYGLDIEQNPDYPNLQRYQHYQQKTWLDVLKPKSVAVVTSTIGRAELERAIVSVQQQSYPCKHYVFVDGEQYFDKVKPLQAKYPDVIFTFLPMNTGADGWTNSSINAIAPFLIKEEIMCYLDDDNWYDSNHVQNIVNGFNSYENVGVVYNLRRFVTENGQYLCDDNTESLGFWGFRQINYPFEFNQITADLYSFMHRQGHVDTNCLAMTLQTAQALAHYWVQSKMNDYMVFKQCRLQNKTIVSTGKRTVNYVLNIKNQEYTNLFDTFKVEESQKVDFIYQMFAEKNNQVLQQVPEMVDWFKPTVFVEGELVRLSETVG